MPGGVLTVGIETAAEVTGRLLERFKSEQTFLIEAGSVCAAVRTAMIGDHNVHNCLLAAAVGLAEGIDLPTIARGLESVGHLPGRLERIECGQPFGAFVDFAHTPDALAAVLAAVREVTAGRLICVFGAGGNRDVPKRPLMGRAVETLADVAIVTSDNPRLEDPRAIAADMLAGFSQPGDARWMPDRAEAITYALSLAGPDDCGARGRARARDAPGNRISARAARRSRSRAAAPVQPRARVALRRADERSQFIRTRRCAN